MTSYAKTLNQAKKKLLLFYVAWTLQNAVCRVGSITHSAAFLKSLSNLAYLSLVNLCQEEKGMGKECRTPVLVFLPPYLILLLI